MSDDRERVWESGWNTHEREQLKRLARLPLAEKLAWIEEASRTARQLAGSDHRSGPGDADPGEKDSRGSRGTNTR